MTEQLLDVKAMMKLLRRAWRTVAAVTLIGLVLGGVYGLSRPPTYTAQAQVLLPSASGSSSGAGAPNSVATDAQIATSDAVLVPAGRKVDPSLSPAALDGRLRASASATASVLSIRATGPSAESAEALANAVADQLVSFVTSSASASISSTVQALQTQAKGLSRQLSTVQSELHAVQARLGGEGTTSVRGRQDANLLQDYTAEETNLQLQVNSIQSQIGQTELQQVSANQGTQVIGRATTASSSVTLSVAIKAAIGLLLGFLLGSAAVLVRHRKDARLFTRDDLAGALGAPVVLSLAARTQRSGSGWVEMFQHYEPSSAEQWNVRKALREVGVVDGSASRLEILMLAGDTAAAGLALQTAVSAAASKTDTVFCFADADSVPALRAACQRLAQRDESPRPSLEVRADDELGYSSAGLTIVGRTVDPGQPAEWEVRPGSVSVLAVTAGTATAEQLARVAIAAADAGGPIRAILVANPGSDDQTTGRFPEASNRATLVLHRRTLGVVTTRRRPGMARAGVADPGALATLPSTLSLAPGDRK